MSLLDIIADTNFRSEKTGRIVIFDRYDRGYIVRSEAEELKIRSFLKMFYLASLSITGLGFLAFLMLIGLTPAFHRPDASLLRTIGIFIGIYLLIVGLPFLLLLRSYKRSFLSFVSVQDAVVVPGRNVSRRSLILAGVTVIAFAGLMFYLRFSN